MTNETKPQNLHTKNGYSLFKQGNNLITTNIVATKLCSLAMVNSKIWGYNTNLLILQVKEFIRSKLIIYSLEVKYISCTSKYIAIINT